MTPEQQAARQIYRALKKHEGIMPLLFDLINADPDLRGKLKRLVIRRKVGI